MRVGRATSDGWLRLGEAAAELGVSLNTLRRWSDTGEIVSYRSPGGHRRYRRADIEALLKAESSPAPRLTGRSATEAPTQETRASLLTLANVALEGLGVQECRISIVVRDETVRLLTAHRHAAVCTQDAQDEGEAPALPTVREVLRTGRRLVISDLAKTSLLGQGEAEALRHRGDASVLALPVLVDGRVRAVFELVESQSPRAFSGANVRFADFMARQAARLIAPAEQPRLPMPAAPGMTSPGETPVSLGVEDPLCALTDRLRRELRAVACDLLRYDPGTGVLEPLASSTAGESPPMLGLLYRAADLGEAAVALSSGLPAGISDLASAMAAGPHLVRRDQCNARSVYAIPLLVEDEAAGLLEVFSDQPGWKPDRDERPLLEAAAATAALALSGSNDPALLSRRLAGLGDLVAGLVAHSPSLTAESLMLSTLASLRSHPDFDACTVYRVTEGVAEPFPPGDDGGSPVESGRPWRLTDYPSAAEAMKRRTPVVLTADADGATGATARFLDRRGLLGVTLTPIVFLDRQVGVLELGSATAEGLAAAAPMAQIAADLFAAALGNGNVIAQLQRRNHDLALVVEAGLEDIARLSTDEILHAVAERLSQLTRTPVVDLYSVEGDALRALVSYDDGRFDPEWTGVVLPLRRYPCCKRAVETGEITVAASLDAPILDEEGRFSLEKWGYQSQLAMPLVAGGRVLGVVELSDYQPRDFAVDLDLLRGLGQAAAHALQNASLFEQVDQRNRTLNELVELGSLASRTRDLDQLVRSVAERVLAGVDGANCDIYRVTGGELRCVASFDRSGHDESVLGSVFDLDRYPTTAEAVFNHQILTIGSPDDPQLSEGERIIYRDYGFSSEACLPLVVHDELYGLLDVYDTRERDFSEYLALLRGAAQILAGAFENARHVERLEQRTTALRDLIELGAVAAQAHDLEQVLTALAQRLRSGIDATGCTIFTLEGESLRCLMSADRDGLDTSVVGRVLDIGCYPAAATAVATGDSTTITSLDDPRLGDEDRKDMVEHGYQSELFVPLIGGDRVIGLIAMFDTRPRDYAEYAEVLGSVGQTAAGLIENAILLDKLERRGAALSELVELGRIASSAGGLGALVRAVGPRVVELMEADGCQVFILRGNTLHRVLTYDRGGFLDDFADGPLDLDLFPSTRTAIEERMALVIESPEDPRLSDYERRLYRESGAQSEICVPLVLEGRVVGLLDVYDHRRRDYAEHHDFVLRVGQMMAGTFENALLMERLEESNQTLGLLVESSMEFGATLDRDEVLESVARRLCEATSAPNCDIFTLHGRSIRCVACIDRGEPDPSYVGTEYAVDQLGLARIALESRRPEFAEDITTDDRVSEFERREDLTWGHRSTLCLPLINRNQVIGLAGVYDDHARRFERVDFLHSLAQVAAAALVNATLYDELDRNAERMALVGDVSFELTSSLELEEVLHSTARRLCTISRTPMCDIYVLREGRWLESVISIDGGEADPDWQGRRFSLDDWQAMRTAMETQAPIEIQSRDDPGLSAAEIALMEAYGERGSLIVPLISRERVIGALELAHRDPRRRWSHEEKATIVSICRFAALAIDNAELYEGIKGMHLSNLKALSSALNAKDYYTLGHAARVAAYMVLLGQELGWPEHLLHEVEEAAYLHDIGKIGVPDRVLLKPSGLNSHEWELMRQHPIFSAEIIQPLFEDELVAGVRHHHERWDGDGYPDGLAGDAIPSIARAMCVADSYDAMSFRRPYRQGLTDLECLEELERCAGIQFDPQMVAAFRRVLDRLAEGRRLAARVADRAAAGLTAEECLALREARDASSPHHASVVDKLLKACGDGAPARFITLFGRHGRRTIVLAHSESSGGPGTPHPGDEVVSDDELAEAFAGRELPANVLYVDQWGVWVSGVAPVKDADGTVVAVVSADFPAAQGTLEMEGLRSNVAQTFASMLHTAAVQSGRSELEAITDGLTGLYNHRYFHERLSEEIERCQEQDTSLSLLFCDLDNFRAFNDQHGHGSGDKALRAVARVLEGSVRHVDLVARYGGEEFAAILIDTAETGALEVAERIRDGITRLRFGADGLSVSIGVATCPKDATFKDELVDKADWAMYLAKRRGRDKVMTFSSEHGGETPEQAAVVRPEHVAAMGELVAAHEAFRQRRRSSIAQIALAVARIVGVPADDIQAAVAALATGSARTGPAGRIVAVAETYQSLVTNRPYRARISEAEALDELRRCPALLGEEDLARAFEQVLAH